MLIRCITANPSWDDIFESSKLKARTSLLPRFNGKRRSSFELWVFETAFENVTPGGIGCTIIIYFDSVMSLLRFNVFSHACYCYVHRWRCSVCFFVSLRDRMFIKWQPPKGENDDYDNENFHLPEGEEERLETRPSGGRNLNQVHFLTKVDFGIVPEMFSWLVYRHFPLPNRTQRSFLSKCDFRSDLYYGGWTHAWVQRGSI